MFFLSIGEASQCYSVCQHWYELATEGEWVKRGVLHGNVAPSERKKLWSHLAGVHQLQDRWCEKLIHEAVHGVNGTPMDSSRSFEALANHPLPKGKLAEIERDVHRTLPTHPRFCGDEGLSGRQDMLKVLRATAVAEPLVGYCQGMNFIAAVFLITLGSAHDAFWMLLALLDGYHYRGIFAPGVPLLPLRIYQFSSLVRERLPRLWRHLQFENSSIDIFAHQCVMTLFAYSIEPGILALVWDAFFLMGWKAIFQVGLGLLATLEPKLLSMDIEQISAFLHQCKRHIEVPKDDSCWKGAQQVLRGLLKFEVSSTSLEDLERGFQKERWRQLLSLTGSGSTTAHGPLPSGIERAADGEGVTLDLSSMHSENNPPWQSAAAPPQSCTEEAASLVKVSMQDLARLRLELDDHDSQTNHDAVVFQERVRKKIKALDLLQKELEPALQEVALLELSCEDGRICKQALMDTLQVAVKTSAVARPPPQANMGSSTNGDEEPAPNPTPPPARTDGAVVECLSKLNRLESELFDKQRRRQSLVDELSSSSQDLLELRDMAARAKLQLQEFLDERQLERGRLFEAGMNALLCTVESPPVVSDVAEDGRYDVTS